MDPDRLDLIVMACCILHNMLRTEMVGDAEADQENPNTHEVIPGDWRDAGVNIQGDPLRRPVNRARATRAALAQRDYLKEYVSGPGQVPWQDSRL